MQPLDLVHLLRGGALVRVAARELLGAAAGRAVRVEVCALVAVVARVVVPVALGPHRGQVLVRAEVLGHGGHARVGARAVAVLHRHQARAAADTLAAGAEGGRVRLRPTRFALHGARAVGDVVGGHRATAAVFVLDLAAKGGFVPHLDLHAAPLAAEHAPVAPALRAVGCGALTGALANALELALRHAVTHLDSVCKGAKVHIAVVLAVLPQPLHKLLVVVALEHRRRERRMLSPVLPQPRDKCRGGEAGPRSVPG